MQILLNWTTLKKDTNIVMFKRISFTQKNYSENVNPSLYIVSHIFHEMINKIHSCNHKVMIFRENVFNIQEENMSESWFMKTSNNVDIFLVIV